MPPFIEAMRPQLVSYGTRAFRVLIAVWAAFRVTSWLETNVAEAMERRGADRALSLFTGALARWPLVAAAVLVCLGVFGIETTSFAAALGAAGLALSGTLANVAAGVMLLAFRRFKIGDLVRVSGKPGSVKEIGLLATMLDSVDHRRIVFPDSVVGPGKIENLAANKFRRVDINVATSYEADAKNTRAALTQAAKSVPGRDPNRGHKVIVLELGEPAVKWQVRVWCATGVYWEVWDATIASIRQALVSRNMPFVCPKMSVHLRQAC